MKLKPGITGTRVDTAEIWPALGLKSVRKTEARSDVSFSSPACAAAYACV